MEAAGMVAGMIDVFVVCLGGGGGGSNVGLMTMMLLLAVLCVWCCGVSAVSGEDWVVWKGMPTEIQ
jgi:hypothetical protein